MSLMGMVNSMMACPSNLRTSHISERVMAVFFSHQERVISARNHYETFPP